VRIASDVILADPVEASGHTDELDGLPVFWREHAADGVPALYLHDVPLSCDEWTPFLDADRGPWLAPDLPGFGRTGKPGSLPYDLPFYDAWIERFLDWREVERAHLVMHGWGALGLLFAQRRPERVGRVVLIAALPLLPGFEWRREARLWRVPVLGETVIGATSGRRFRKRLPQSLAAGEWAHFDPGTQRALLRLHRSAPEDALARAGEHLELIPGPALILSGASDQYIDVAFADAYSARMSRAIAACIPAAGHWPWLDDSGVVERVLTFLRG
jgi:pimeloyl-ACP methyl ester carboxylesterase